jgi:hypothetical protein
MGSAAYDQEMKPFSYTDYNQIPNKLQASRPSNYLTMRLKDQTNLKLWPLPSEQAVLKVCVLRRFNDITSPLNDVDAPFRFLPALTYGLAYRLALARSDGSPQWETKLNRLRIEADRTWQLATTDDKDDSSFTIVPRTR